MGPPEARDGPAGRALGSSVRGNSTAFGFSLTVTVSFGMLTGISGSGSVLEMLLFGVASALAVSLFEAAISRGFRVELTQVSQRADMLGTAMNFLSVAAAVAAAAGIAEIVDGVAAWPLAGFLATALYILVESAEIFLADSLERDRGGDGVRGSGD